MDNKLKYIIQNIYAKVVLGIGEYYTLEANEGKIQGVKVQRVNRAKKFTLTAIT